MLLFHLIFHPNCTLIIYDCQCAHVTVLPNLLWSSSSSRILHILETGAFFVCDPRPHERDKIVGKSSLREQKSAIPQNGGKFLVPAHIWFVYWGIRHDIK